MQQLLLDGIMIAVILSTVPMVVIAFVSGTVALLQAATQVQEQSIIHLVKIFAFVIVILILGDWASSEVLSLFERSLQTLELVARGGA